ncbi:MAG: F420-0:gamma-glutamyl ligase, partial [Acidimicrobiales bacterium]
MYANLANVMQILPIKTRIMNPPQDDIFPVLDEYLSDVQEGDVILISSKIVAISEGRTVRLDEVDKAELVASEADLLVPRSYWYSPLTVVRSAFIGTSGIDESNSGEYLVMLPKDAFFSAKEIHEYLKKRFDVKNIGVVITDSHSQPLRRGASGISVGFWGFEPVIDHIGKKDLFGRKIKIEQSNLVDGLAAAATVVMGEVDECQPVVIARGVPDLMFTEENKKDTLFVPFEDDT